MKTATLSIFVISAVSAAMGFTTTSLDIGEKDVQSAQSWGSLPLPIDYSESANRFLTELVASGAFPISELQSNRIDTSDANPGARPTFPTVIAIGILDGVYTAQIVTREGELRTVRQNDVIVNNWSVKTIDMHKLVLTNATDDVAIEY